MYPIINFLGTNKFKLAAVKEIFSHYSIPLEILTLDVPEIQAATSMEIARHQAKQAAKMTNAIVLREDGSLYLDKLGIPGPFVARQEKIIPPALLVEMLGEYNTGYFEIAASLCSSTEVLFETTYRVNIKINSHLVGDGPGWDPILMFSDENRTFAQMSFDEKMKRRTGNYEKIAEFIVSRFV